MARTKKNTTLRRTILLLVGLTAYIGFCFVAIFYPEILILIVGFIPAAISFLAQALNQKQ